MIKLNKHGMISKRLIAHEFAVGNTVVEGGGTPEELSVLSLTKDQLDALSYIVNGEGRIIPVGEDGTFDTKIGHSYCIRHTDDLILHEAWLSNNENLYVKRFGSGQLLFFATSEKCKINDPSYIVTEVFRMAALNDFVDWSGVTSTQKWFKELEVELEILLGSKEKFELDILDENTVVIHTDRLNEKQLESVSSLIENIIPQNVEEVQYNHNIEISWRNIDKYVECANISDMSVVNPDYKKDLTSEGEWIYPLTGLTNANDMFNQATGIKKINLTLPNATSCHWFLAWASCDEVSLDLPKLTSANQIFRDAQVNIFRIKIPETLTNINEMCAGWGTREIYGNFEHVKSAYRAFDRQNYKMLRVLDSDWSSLSNGEGMFDLSILHKNVALRVLTTIPAYSSGDHPLTLGIHVDYKTDPEILEAITNAEAKGWTMTVQWNGTPTSTASTMAMGQLIYAKVSEHELPDGMTERVLDWGHYVTNPEGYETFRSLESAYSYFELEMPEEEQN